MYNVHSIIHLARECFIHGPLDSFSCFPFETYLNRLKKLVRSTRSPLAQLVKRISEIDYITSLEKSNVRPSIFNLKNRNQSTNIEPGTKKDSYYMTKEKIFVKILSSTQEGIVVKKFRTLDHLYTDPLKSKVKLFNNSSHYL